MTTLNYLFDRTHQHFSMVKAAASVENVVTNEVRMPITLSQSLSMSMDTMKEKTKGHGFAL